MSGLSKFFVEAVFLVQAAASLFCQVLSPMEIADGKARQLQQAHLKQLMAVGSGIQAHKFPYPFFFSRILDIDLSQMQRADQRSIRFDTYKGQVVLEVTGNYYAAYSSERMDAPARLKETFEQVVVPILSAEVEHFSTDSDFSSLAIETSHHVRQDLNGVITERPENVVAIVPVAAAQKLVRATTHEQREAAILESQFFLNGEPYGLWLDQTDSGEHWKKKDPAPAGPASVAVDQNPVGAGNATDPSPSSATKSVPRAPLTPDALAALQSRYQESIDKMVKALDPQAHFIPYAPPAFVDFRHGAYLQLSLHTSFDVAPGSSRYKLAALAFDSHVSHLIRPLLEQFPEDASFDGVTFSSMVQLSDSRSEAVEFFFLLSMMRRFAAYDCSGQQLLDSGVVLIDGERAEVTLQVAEGQN